jgi:CBS-domain-containing membrane protein
MPPINTSQASSLPRHSLRDNLSLALMPTITVLIVFAVVEEWSHRRLLFASLASSAFLIYLDPKHETNSGRTLVFAQGLAALVGFAAHALLGSSFWAAGGAMVVIIFAMIFARAMHPPAVSTALSFALGAGSGRGLLVFAVCVGLIIVLVFVQRTVVRLLFHRKVENA